MSHNEAFRRAVLQAAVQAPSGDNLQPWRFAWVNDDLILLHEANSDTSLYNVRHLASFIALGACLENIIIAASSRGYHATPALFPEGHAEGTVAKIKFDRGGEADPLATAIDKRCSNRKPYPTIPLTPGTVASLSAQVNSFSGLATHWVQRQDELKKLSKIAAHGDRMLFENPSIHSHFFSSIRWTNKEVEATRDGLPVQALELGRLGSTGFKLLESWLAVRILNCLGLSRIAAGHSGALIEKSSAVGMITASQISRETFLSAGRGFERLWLSATSQGLSLQPMTGFILLQLRSTLEEWRGFTERQIRQINSNRIQLADFFQLTGEIPAVMFRVGRGGLPTDRTVRRTMSGVLDPAAVQPRME